MNSWFRYQPLPETGPALANALPWQFWWNEWWYNDPFLQPGAKWIQLGFTWKPIDPLQPVDFHIIINWTNGGWIGKNAPPIPFGQPGGNTDNPERYIVRANAYDFFWEPVPGQVGNSPWSFTYDKFWIREYNPEWVSVDVRGANFELIPGWIEHQCVPLPAAVWLLGPGLVGLGVLRRRFRG